MTNMDDLLDAVRATGDAVCDAAEVARKAGDVYDVAEARVLDASCTAQLAREAADAYADKHGLFCYHD